MSRATSSKQGTDFGKTIADAYQTTGAAIELGQGVHDGQLVHQVEVRVQREVVRGVFGLLKKRI
jgi:hypothetical protein